MRMEPAEVQRRQQATAGVVWAMSFLLDPRFFGNEIHENTT